MSCKVHRVNQSKIVQGYSLKGYKIVYCGNLLQHSKLCGWEDLLELTHNE